MYNPNNVGREACSRREFRQGRNSHRPQDDRSRSSCLPARGFFACGVKSRRGQAPRPTVMRQIDKHSVLYHISNILYLSILTSIKNSGTIKEPMGKDLLKEDDHGIWK
jgi:hypothetical protein